jgi:multidrug resistance protein, MATE family
MGSFKPQYHLSGVFTIKTISFLFLNFYFTPFFPKNVHGILNISDNQIFNVSYLFKALNYSEGENVSTEYNLTKIINEFKTSIKLAIPLVTAEVVYGLNTFISTMMVSRLGKEELAANVLVWEVFIATTVFFWGIVGAVGVMCAHSYGANDPRGCSISFKQGLIITILFSLPMMLFTWIMPTTLTWLKQDPVVIKLAEPYFHSLVWAVLPMNLSFVLQQLFSGINKARLVLIMSIAAVPIESFLYYTFLFGKFGFPQMGLAGIGYSLTITWSLISLFFIGYLFFSQQFRIYEPFKNWWHIEVKFLKEMLRIGLPMGLLFSSELVFFAVATLMVGTIGITTLAAYQIGYQYLMIGLVVLFGLSQTTLIRIGHEAGRNNREGIKLVRFVNILIALGFSSLFSLFYLIFPEKAISLDFGSQATNQEGVIGEAIKFFPLVSILLLSDCIRLINSNALRGLKDLSSNLVISIVGFWLIAFPVAYSLAFKFNLGGYGIWEGIIIGSTITGGMLWFRFNRLINRVDLLSMITKK